MDKNELLNEARRLVAQDVACDAWRGCRIAMVKDGEIVGYPSFGIGQLAELIGPETPPVPSGAVVFLDELIERILTVRENADADPMPHVRAESLAEWHTLACNALAALSKPLAGDGLKLVFVAPVPSGAGEDERELIDRLKSIMIPESPMHPIGCSTWELEAQTAVDMAVDYIERAALSKSLAGAGEARDIVRRWAQWIIDTSDDMDLPEGAPSRESAVRKVRDERDRVLAALSKPLAGDGEGEASALLPSSGDEAARQSAESALARAREKTTLAHTLAERGADKAGCDGWRAQEMCRQIADLLKPEENAG